MRGLRLAAAVGAAALAAGACARLAPEAPPAPSGNVTGAAMAEIVAALRVALPLSLLCRALRGPPTARPSRGVARALRAGRSSSSHGRSRMRASAYLEPLLARDADIKRRFDAGRLDESRFLLGALVEDCVGCPRGSRARRTATSARCSTARWTRRSSRRSSAASRWRPGSSRPPSRYEALLAAPDASPAELDVEGVLNDYLTGAIRVRQDLPRARATLSALATRPDVPSYLATLLSTWVSAGDALAGSLAAPTRSRSGPAWPSRAPRSSVSPATTRR
jgi:hypothetical protein